jgi:DNA-binding transcriptional regulator PaaX
MSMVMEILESLWNVTAYYKGMRVNIFGFPMPWKPSNAHTKNSIDSTVSRMKKNGFLEIKNGKWSLTEKGKRYFEEKKRLSVKFSSPFVINAPKNVLAMFDIPQSQRAKRDWLRWHLKEFGYEMVQQSVWVGPGPLPAKFKDYLKEIGIEKCIKFFKLAGSYK